jgi:hypothetical protein
MKPLNATKATKPQAELNTKTNKKQVKSDRSINHTEPKHEKQPKLDTNSENEDKLNELSRSKSEERKEKSFDKSTIGRKYSLWICESAKGEEFVHCEWCKTDFLRKNITGASGHLLSESHINEEKKRKPGLIAQVEKAANTEIDGQIKLVNEDLPTQTNLFELNLLQFLVIFDHVRHHH